MTDRGVIGPLFRCSGCGAEAGSTEKAPLPLACPNAAAGDGIDHVLGRAPLAAGPFAAGGEENPFLRYRPLSAAYALARREGLSDDAYAAIVARLDRAVAEVEGHGFVRTPMARADALAEALGGPPFELWVKDETGNVSGSHKARHLMGILVYLEVARAVGLPVVDAPRLAIASCGNAALAAAVVARAARLPLDVFIPPDANPRVVERLSALGARTTICARSAESPPGDPCYHAFRAAVDAGALPFCCQGGDDALTIDGGETLAFEIAEQAPPLDALFVQVGGGALASALMQGLLTAQAAGVLAGRPRVHTVQTRGAFPLARAYERVVERLVARVGEPAPSDPLERASWLRARAGAFFDQELAYAAQHRASFMWPWEEPPHSVAHGILDDETYDWLAVVRGMLETGGVPLVVDEDTLIRANQLARAHTTVPVDATGSSGLAGLVALRALAGGRVGARVGVVFSGRDRDLGY